MSVIVGGGMWISYDESEVTCPICTAVFDASAKIERAKNPVFKTKCPKCKGKITISTPVFGGQLECWETDCPPNVERMRTKTPNKVNGRIVEPKPYDSNWDETDEDREEDGEGWKV